MATTTQKTGIKLVTRDDRARVPLGRAARHEHYLITEMGDGRILLTPAVVKAVVDPGRQSAEQVVAGAAHAAEHPETLVRGRTLLRGDGSRSPAGGHTTADRA